MTNRQISIKLRAHLRPRTWLLLGSILLTVIPNLSAAVTYSGVVNIPISTTFAGIYLDIGNGVDNQPSNDPDAVLSDSYRIGYTQPASWDVNFFFGGIGIAYSPTFRPFVDGTVGNYEQILNVAAGTEIGTAAAERTNASSTYGGSGRPNGGSGSSHFDTPTVALDPTYSAFTPGTSGYIAFVLNPGPNPQYGWMNVTLTNTGIGGIIHEWAFSDESTFRIAQIPEPASSVAVLAAGLIMFCGRRRNAA